MELSKLGRLLRQPITILPWRQTTPPPPLRSTRTKEHFSSSLLTPSLSPFPPSFLSFLSSLPSFFFFPFLSNAPPSMPARKEARTVRERHEYRAGRKKVCQPCTHTHMMGEEEGGKSERKRGGRKREAWWNAEEEERERRRRETFLCICAFITSAFSYHHQFRVANKNLTGSPE